MDEFLIKCFSYNIFWLCIPQFLPVPLLYLANFILSLSFKQKIENKKQRDNKEVNNEKSHKNKNQNRQKTSKTKKMPQQSKTTIELVFEGQLPLGAWPSLECG